MDACLVSSPMAQDVMTLMNVQTVEDVNRTVSTPMDPFFVPVKMDSLLMLMEPPAVVRFSLSGSLQIESSGKCS